MTLSPASCQILAQVFGRMMFSCQLIVRHFHSVVEIVLHDVLVPGSDSRGSKLGSEFSRALVCSKREGDVKLHRAL